MKEEWGWKGLVRKVRFYNRGGWHVITFYYFLGIPAGMWGPNGTRDLKYSDQENKTPDEQS